jgi:hypothetical protein
VIQPANWTFASREDAGEGSTWFFYGSALTSKVGGGATTAEQQDWGNICNWYSAKSTSPAAGQQTGPTTLGMGGSVGEALSTLTKRATRFPDENATIHVYTPISTATVGPRVVRNAYFWGDQQQILTSDSDIECTDALAGITSASCGALFVNCSNLGIVRGGAGFMGTNRITDSAITNKLSIGNGGNATAGGSYDNSDGEIIGHAFFSGHALNWATVTGTGYFYGTSTPFLIGTSAVNGMDQSSSSGMGYGSISDGAEFWGGRNIGGSVENGAVFKVWNSDTATNAISFAVFPFREGVINDGAEFNDDSINGGTVNGGAVFTDTSENRRIVNGGAIFEDSSFNSDSAGVVNGGGEFFDNSYNKGGFTGATARGGGTVNGGATFNNAACSERYNTVGGVRIFRTNNTDVPTCNGTAPPGSDPTATCGCG